MQDVPLLGRRPLHVADAAETPSLALSVTLAGEANKRKNMQLKSIEDVVDYQQCTGCGVCAYIEAERYEMVDEPAYGRRPSLKPNAVKETGEAFRACPGKGLVHPSRKDPLDETSQDHPCWGPITSVYEGHARAEDLRWVGSSGGVITALAAACVEKFGITGVLHAAMDENRPYLNKTVYSKTTDQIKKAAGSRYSPASPCDGLSSVEAAKGQSVFIGKPCDVAAVRMAVAENPALTEKIGLTIAFFCAGVPSTDGLLSLLKKSGIENPEDLEHLKYRGCGWPGKWEAKWSVNGETKAASLTYDESWGYLEAFRQWRCRVCVDHSGEFADISVGDPWYRELTGNEKGSSLIIARTGRGNDFLKKAIAAGTLNLEPADATLIDRSQPNLIKSRGQLWGRLFALKLMRAPFPKYEGFAMFRFWWAVLTMKEKIQSIGGTIKRIFRKNLRKRSRQNVMS